MAGLLFPLVVIIAAIFIFATIMDSKDIQKKTSRIRNLYFYLASLVTLGFVVGSLIATITIGLQISIFTQADPIGSRIGPPPSLYLFSAKSDGSEVIPLSSAYTCTDSCEFSEEQLSMINDWQSEYESWKRQMANPSEGRLRDLIAALSFLIVALPLFIIHYRVVRKEEKKTSGQQGGVIKSLYYYFVSLTALVMVVIASGILINAGLKSWLLPDFIVTSDTERIAPGVMAEELQGTNSIINCGGVCNISDDAITSANNWRTDYIEWRKSGATYNGTQRQAAASLPYILLGIPLFWYHWIIARRGSKEKNNNT